MGWWMIPTAITFLAWWWTFLPARNINEDTRYFDAIGRMAVAAIITAMSWVAYVIWLVVANFVSLVYF